MESEDGNTIIDESGKARNLVCGTEKGRHVTKNHKTAGKHYTICEYFALFTEPIRYKSGLLILLFKSTTFQVRLVNPLRDTIHNEKGL